MAVMKGRNGLRLLLIDTELHDRSGQNLYALCSPNDILKTHSDNDDDDDVDDVDADVEDAR